MIVRCDKVQTYLSAVQSAGMQAITDLLLLQLQPDSVSARGKPFNSLRARILAADARSAELIQRRFLDYTYAHTHIIYYAVHELCTYVNWSRA